MAITSISDTFRNITNDSEQGCSFKLGLFMISDLILSYCKTLRFLLLSFVIFLATGCISHYAINDYQVISVGPYYQWSKKKVEAQVPAEESTEEINPADNFEDKKIEQVSAYSRHGFNLSYEEFNSNHERTVLESNKISLAIGKKMQLPIPNEEGVVELQTVPIHHIHASYSPVVARVFSNPPLDLFKTSAEFFLRPKLQLNYSEAYKDLINESVELAAGFSLGAKLFWIQPQIHFNMVVSQYLSFALGSGKMGQPHSLEMGLGWILKDTNDRKFRSKGNRKAKYKKKRKKSK